MQVGIGEDQGGDRKWRTILYSTGMVKLLVCGRSLEELKGATSMDARKLS